MRIRWRRRRQVARPGGRCSSPVRIRQVQTLPLNIVHIYLKVLCVLCFFSGTSEHLWVLFPDVFMVLTSEVAVDIIKHAFITKFNDITAEVRNTILHVCGALLFLHESPPSFAHPSTRCTASTEPAWPLTSSAVDRRT